MSENVVYIRVLRVNWLTIVTIPIYLIALISYSTILCSTKERHHYPRTVHLGRYTITARYDHERLEISEEGLVPGTRGTFWTQWR